MTNPEAKFALFSATNFAGSPSHVQRGLEKLQGKLNTIAATNTAIQILGQSAAMLILPDMLPILSECVVIAQDHSLPYRVDVFGHPLLSYSSEQPPKNPAG